MKVFNSIQIVALFAGFPYLISWLSSEPFRHSGVAFWTAVVAYVVSFAIMCGITYEALHDK